jgi:hypothetical protein
VGRSLVALSIASATLPTAQRRTPYRAQLVAAGGTAPYTWTRVTGKLPKGLRLGRDGHVTGTAKVRTSKRVQVRVRDAQGASVKRWVRLRVR